MSTLGVIAIVLSWDEWKVHRAIGRGPKAEAIVDGLGACPSWWGWRGSCGNYETGLTVHFRVRNRTMQRTTIVVNDPEHHPVGSRLTVRYDGSHPDRAEYVHHGSRVLVTLVGGTLSLMTSLGIGLLYLRARIIGSERPPTADDVASLGQERERLSGR